MKHILKCENGHYTLQELCKQCHTPATSPKPAKYSPEDPYGKYRRTVKHDDRVKRGIV